MNRARWMWFFTCFLDLHNLDLQGRLHETHPRYSKANQNQETEASLEKQGNFSAENTSAEADGKGSVSTANHSKQMIEHNSEQSPPTKLGSSTNDVAMVEKAFSDLSIETGSSCPECKKKMTSLKGLKQHLLRIHDIDGDAALKAHKCPICQKGFKVKSQLNRHVKTSKKCQA